MILDTSYSDRETTRKINSAVGPAFTFTQRWKMGGIGSPRMAIDAISEKYMKYLNAAHYQSNANIELRPKGILVHFRHKLQAYAWIMPYTDLNIEWNETLTLKVKDDFIRFNPPINEQFVNRMTCLLNQAL